MLPVEDMGRKEEERGEETAVDGRMHDEKWREKRKGAAPGIIEKAKGRRRLIYCGNEAIDDDKRGQEEQESENYHQGVQGRDESTGRLLMPRG